jgi:protein O-GlcNAc transferase
MKRRIISLEILFVLFVFLSCYHSPYISSGLLYLEQREYDKAITQFKLAIEAEPTRPRPYLLLAETYRRKNENDSVAIYIKKATEIDIIKTKEILGEYKRLTYSYLLFDLAKEHIDNEEYRIAIDKLQMALLINDNYVSSMNLMAYCYLKFKNEEKAKELFENAIEVEPDSISTYLFYADYYKEKKKLKEEEDILTKAKLIIESSDWYIRLHLENVLEVYSCLGYNKLWQGKPAEAEIEFKKALVIDPKSKALNYDYALAMLELRKLNKAIEYLENSISGDSTDVDSYYYLGFAHLELKEFEEAILFYTKAIELDPECEKAYKGRATCYYYIGDKEKLERDLKYIKEDISGDEIEKIPHAIE